MRRSLTSCSTLNHISSRLDELDVKFNQLNFNLDFALQNITRLPQDLKEPIDSLKAGLRSFTQGLVDQLVGDQQPTVVEGSR